MHAEPRFDLLPEGELVVGGPVSKAFAAAGCGSVREAARRVWRLPYGRNRQPDEPLCVLKEGRGTCSSKHALLARLLAEQGVGGIELRTGIYEMSEANTPGVGATLERHGLRSIPEAHCYLANDGEIIDVTRVVPPGREPIGGFLIEEVIEPWQTGEYKREFHRRFLAAYAEKAGAGGLSAERLWDIREECIAALAE